MICNPSDPSLSRRVAEQQQHKLLEGAAGSTLLCKLQVGLHACCKLWVAAGVLSKAHAAVEKLQAQLQLAGQPHGYLLSQLAAAQAAADRAQEQLKQAQVTGTVHLVLLQQVMWCLYGSMCLLVNKH